MKQIIVQVKKALIMSNWPWAKLTSFMTPKIMFKPVAKRMYTQPMATPQTNVKMIVGAVISMVNTSLLWFGD